MGSAELPQALKNMKLSQFYNEGEAIKIIDALVNLKGLSESGKQSVLDVCGYASTILKTDIVSNDDIKLLLENKDNLISALDTMIRNLNLIRYLEENISSIDSSIINEMSLDFNQNVKNAYANAKFSFDEYVLPKLKDFVEGKSFDEEEKNWLFGVANKVLNISELIKSIKKLSSSSSVDHIYDSFDDAAEALYKFSDLNNDGMTKENAQAAIEKIETFSTMAGSNSADSGAVNAMDIHNLL